MYKIFFDLVHVLDLIEKNGKVNHWKLASDQDKVCFIKTDIQQGLEIHGLEECGPWRYTVFDWFSKHLRYTDFGQKP